MTVAQLFDGDDEMARAAQIPVGRRAISREEYGLVAMLVAMFAVILVLAIVMGVSPPG